MNPTGPIPDDLIPLKAEVDRLAAIIGAPSELLPAYDYWVEGYHTEHKYGGYHLVHVERGKENSRITVSTADELLYHIFLAITRTMADEYARKFLVANKDSRRDYFPKRVELLAQLSQEWAARAQKEQEAILQDHPYDDLSQKRTEAFVSFRKQRLSDDLALQKAYKLYPKPEGNGTGRKTEN